MVWQQASCSSLLVNGHVITARQSQTAFLCQTAGMYDGLYFLLLEICHTDSIRLWEDRTATEIAGLQIGCDDCMLESNNVCDFGFIRFRTLIVSRMLLLKAMDTF